MINYADFNIISILLTLISILGGFLLWYVIKIFKEATNLGGDIATCNKRINKLSSDFLETKAQQQNHFSKILSGQESAGERLTNLRRALDDTSLENRSWREDIARIIGDTERNNNFMEESRKTSRVTINVLKQHQTEIKRITDELILIRDKK